VNFFGDYRDKFDQDLRILTGWFNEATIRAMENISLWGDQHGDPMDLDQVKFCCSNSSFRWNQIGFIRELENSFSILLEIELCILYTVKNKENELTAKEN